MRSDLVSTLVVYFDCMAAWEREAEAVSDQMAAGEISVSDGKARLVASSRAIEQEFFADEVIERRSEHGVWWSPRAHDRKARGLMFEDQSQRESQADELKRYKLVKQAGKWKLLGLEVRLADGEWDSSPL